MHGIFNVPYPLIIPLSDFTLRDDVTKQPRRGLAPRASRVHREMENNGTLAAAAAFPPRIGLLFEKRGRRSPRENIALLRQRQLIVAITIARVLLLRVPEIKKSHRECLRFDLTGRGGEGAPACVATISLSDADGGCDSCYLEVW